MWVVNSRNKPIHHFLMNSLNPMCSSWLIHTLWHRSLLPTHYSFCLLLSTVFSSPSFVHFHTFYTSSTIFWPYNPTTLFSLPLIVLYSLAFLLVSPRAPNPGSPSLLCSTFFLFLTHSSCHTFLPIIPLHLTLCSPSLSRIVRHSSSSLSSSETGNLLILTDGVLMEHPEELYRMQVSLHVL